MGAARRLALVLILAHELIDLGLEHICTRRGRRLDGPKSVVGGRTRDHAPDFTKSFPRVLLGVDPSIIMSVRQCHGRSRLTGEYSPTFLWIITLWLHVYRYCISF